MTRFCPSCGCAILSDRSNFCPECGQQLRGIPPEDIDLVKSEEDRHNPMPVREKTFFIKPEVREIMREHPEWYVYQFGPFHKGAGYIRDVINLYPTVGNVDVDICSGLLAQVCVARAVNIASSRRAIQRFLKAAWSRGFQHQWKTYTGWIEQYPPDVDDALWLILKSWSAFIIEE